MLNLSIFIPCFNESKFIASTLDEVLGALEHFNLTYEIIVIDDASRDDSARVISAYISKNHQQGKISFTRNNNNRGLARNFFAGTNFAKGEYYIVLPGDNAIQRSDIQKILNLLGKADIIVVNFNTRFFSKNNRDYRPFHRRLLSIVFNRFLVKVCSGHRLNYFNGPALYKRRDVLKYRVDTPGYAFLAEMLCKMLNDGHSFLEVVVDNRDFKGRDSSSLSISSFFYAIRSLVNIVRYRFR